MLSIHLSLEAKKEQNHEDVFSLNWDWLLCKRTNSDDGDNVMMG